MNIRISNKDMIWGYLGYFFTISTNLLILPFVMRFVETKELGLWYTFLSVGQFVTLLDFGFSNTLVRNITYAYSGAKEIYGEGFSEKNEDDNKTNYRLLASILKTCQIICFVIAMLAATIMLTGGSVYILHASRSLPVKKILTSWVIYTLAVFFNIYYSYWISALKGIGAIVQAQKANVFSKALQIIVSLSLLVSGGGIVALVIAYLISGIFIRVYAKHQFRKYENVWSKINQYIISIDRKELLDNLKKVWVNAKKSGIVSLGTFCTTQTTTLLCSNYLGLDVTASYGLCLQIITALTNVAAIYFQTMVPVMTELKISNKIEELKNIFSTSISIFWILYFFGLITFFLVGLPLISILRADTVLPVPMLLMLGIYLFLEMNHSLFSTYISFSNNIPYMKPAIISGFAIVIGEIIAIKVCGSGIYGLMIVQFLIQLAYNNWKWPFMVFRELKLTPGLILRRAYRRIISYVQIKKK